MRTIPNNFTIPTHANYIQAGTGSPVILIHGVAASLHDWDDLIPVLSEHGYASYALDLLGHGDSPKLESHAYQMDWMLDHFSTWMRSLHLTEPAILIGHSMGGYIALEYARRVSAWTRGLILIDPFYSLSQLPALLRRTYLRPRVSSFIVGRTPSWMFRLIVEMTSRAMGHSTGAIHSLPERIRAQTAFDYTRTSPGVYSVLNDVPDINGNLATLSAPTLVVWGERDKTLHPSSFSKLVNQMPRAVGKSLRAGHVPHQSNASEFNRIALEFLKGLD
ncbi:MAG TPA: alpha/beta hydrolase [Anaerolineales bacterium]|jgi:pimeloyl-ACP methyl ester carboxylesterase|nr:alpha/beta hydrolase [Anaerolineales bacterium]